MIFKRRSADYITKNFTHWGLLFGLLPIYLRLHYVVVDDTGHGIIDDRDSESEFPAMEEVNWIPKPLFYLGSALYGAWLYGGLSVHWELPAPVIVCGEV